jgi:hypothetical protein
MGMTYRYDMAAPRDDATSIAVIVEDVLGREVRKLLLSPR